MIARLKRPLGYAAKEYIVEFSRDAALSITRDYGRDRLVIDLSVNGQGVETAIIDAGHSQMRDYVGGDPKTSWRE